ncbi:hypothetical protein AAF107_17265 [Acinetobacter baumannii]|uniref:hypothetical protein n=1 Tax=Acinetobacter baumannii TaxID=470 RepID=UPI00313E0688
MKNALSIKRTTNSSGSTKLERTADTKEFLFLNGEKRTYAQNLLKDWIAQIRHIQGLKNNTIDNHSANVLRLLNFAQVAPWELKPTDVTNFLNPNTITVRVKVFPHQLMLAIVPLGVHFRISCANLI